jgi:hypothetical protein
MLLGEPKALLNATWFSLFCFDPFTVSSVQKKIPYASLKNYKSLVHLIFKGIDRKFSEKLVRNFFRNAPESFPEKTSSISYPKMLQIVISIDFQSVLQHNRGTKM